MTHFAASPQQLSPDFFHEACWKPENHPFYQDVVALGGAFRSFTPLPVLVDSYFFVLDDRLMHD